MCMCRQVCKFPEIELLGQRVNKFEVLRDIEYCQISLMGLFENQESDMQILGRVKS